MTKEKNSTHANFSSQDAYIMFSSKVRRGRRYVWERDVQMFLDTVRKTAGNRKMKIRGGQILWRAQRGIEYDPIRDEDGKIVMDEKGQEFRDVPRPFSAERMKPLVDKAREGRVNPAGIPVLYLASSEKVAISETRPWVGEEISVSQFRVVRDLTAIDLSQGYGQSSKIFLDADISQEEISKSVWTDIDNAFSRPVTHSDDQADYVPTQILSELFKDCSYDAIVYRSQFDDEGYNIVIFKVEDANPINCAPYRVTKLDVKFNQIGNLAVFR